MNLTIAQLILERCEFSHREDFLALPPTTPVALPSVKLGVQLARDEKDTSKRLVRIVASSPDDTHYRFSVTYTALLNVQFEPGEDVSDLDSKLMVTGCTMMFPFLRQAVANITSQGRFGALWMAPTDFARLIPAAMSDVAAK